MTGHVLPAQVEGTISRSSDKLWMLHRWSMGSQDWRLRSGRLSGPRGHERGYHKGMNFTTYRLQLSDDNIMHHYTKESLN